MRAIDRASTPCSCEYARKECEIYHDMSRVVLEELARVLSWPGWKRRLLLLGLRLTAIYEKLFSWRRLTRLELPERLDALGPREEAAAQGEVPAVLFRGRDRGAAPAGGPR